MIVDFHNHVGIRVGKQQTAEDLIKAMDRAGIDKAIIFPFVENPDNDYIAQAVGKFPGRTIGFACINPWLPGALDELQRSVKQLGLKGLKLHPLLHGYAIDNHELVDAVFETCEKLSIPIIAHGAESLFTMPHAFEEMARTFPNVKLVMAHAGFMYSSDQAIRAAKRNKNLYLDMTATTAWDVTHAVEEVEPARVLMGSDTPFMYYEVEIKKVEMAISDPKVRKMVMGENALRLLDML